jgi:hypothetical protein
MPQSSDLSRRDVLKAAASVTAVAAAVESAPHIRTVHAAGGTVAYGFIGTGSRGSYLLGGQLPEQQHLRTIETGRCVAICDNWDVNLKKGLKAAGRPVAAYTDYRQLLDRKDIDAVFIAVPLYEHFRITRDWCSRRRNFTSCGRFPPRAPARCCRPACSGDTASSTRRPGT